MKSEYEDFNIDYKGIILKVKQAMRNGILYYNVNMISKDIEVFRQFNQRQELHWYEDGKGRTALADDIGYAIENRRIKPKK